MNELKSYRLPARGRLSFIVYRLPLSVLQPRIRNLYGTGFSDLQQTKKVQQGKQKMNYLDLPNLASPQLGTKILFATDEWFAAAGSCEDIFFFISVNFLFFR
jgi:hypothetical protein